MKNNIKFNNSNILYTFSSVNGKYIVELTYNFINQYQLQNTSIKISSKSNNAISSIDVRKLNIYSLNKKAQKQISNLADVDNNYFIQKTGNKNFNKINISKFVKNIHTRNTQNRNELMCQYAYVYDFYIKSNHNNYSLFLAKKLNYSENYIKNLTKELFVKKYLLKNTTGVPGGVFSKKTLKYFNSL
tara:strand:- start:564 stop:1124 length:561 start_codon:yes stop_codon:yes gene_type:complete